MKKRKPYDVIKDREIGLSDWSSDTGNAHEVIKLEKVDLCLFTKYANKGVILKDF